MTAARDALVRALAEPVTVARHAQHLTDPRCRVAGYVTDPEALADRLLAALADDPETVERVAEAIFARDYVNVKARPEWDDLDGQEAYRDLARAALTALRTTEEQHICSRWCAQHTAIGGPVDPS